MRNWTARTTGGRLRSRFGRRVTPASCGGCRVGTDTGLSVPKISQLNGVSGCGADVSYGHGVILAMICSISFTFAGSAIGRAPNLSPSSIVTGLLASNAGQRGRPGPFGSPVRMKFAQ